MNYDYRYYFEKEDNNAAIGNTNTTNPMRSPPLLPSISSTMSSIDDQQQQFMMVRREAAQLQLQMQQPSIVGELIGRSLQLRQRQPQARMHALLDGMNGRVQEIRMKLTKARDDAGKGIMAMESRKQAKERAKKGVAAGDGGPKNPGLYKTELCRNMAMYGQCKFGTNCWFAHSVQEQMARRNVGAGVMNMVGGGRGPRLQQGGGGVNRPPQFSLSATNSMMSTNQQGGGAVAIHRFSSSATATNNNNRHRPFFMPSVPPNLRPIQRRSIPSLISLITPSSSS